MESNGAAKRRRPKMVKEDLATRLMKSTAAENYFDVCINNIFERTTFESSHIRKSDLVIPDSDISKEVPSTLAANMKLMGIEHLLPVQRYTLPLLTDHDTDTFVGAPTGNGKTLAFLLPIAVALMRNMRTESSSRRPIALIISNTQVLQMQTYTVAKSFLAGTHLRAVLACGEMDRREQIKEIVHGVDILIATPGRLRDYLTNEHVSLECLKYFVYDEADKMTEVGAFTEDVVAIRECMTDDVKAGLRSCFFTATLDNMGSFEGMYRQETFSIVRVPGNPLITHELIPLWDSSLVHKADVLMALLKDDLERQGRTVGDQSMAKFEEKTIVFVDQKLRCNFLRSYLVLYGFSVEVINSDISLKMRNEIFQRFSHGAFQVLIATDSMARGHDIPNVKHVINFDLRPSMLDTFKHRAGRTARIGNSGRCTTLLCRTEFMLIDSPLFSDMHFGRMMAAEFAYHLVLECGQRIPRCLQKPLQFAMKKELMRWGCEQDPMELLQGWTIGGKELEEEVDESEEEEEERSEQPTVHQIKKIYGFHDDGMPIFSANASTVASKSDSDEGSVGSPGGIAIDDEQGVYFGMPSDDEFPSDSETDGPNLQDDQAIGECSAVSDKHASMRWTDDDDDDDDEESHDCCDDETKMAHMEALCKQYEAQLRAEAAVDIDAEEADEPVQRVESEARPFVDSDDDVD